MQKHKTTNKALALFDEGYSCSQAILLSFGERFHLDENTAKLISSTFGGGMGRLRQICGAVTGGFMVLGLAYGNNNPTDKDTKLKAYKKVRELNGMVEDIYGTSNCSELLKKHATEAKAADIKHHKIICRKVVGDVAELVYDMLEKEYYLERLYGKTCRYFFHK
jgi:C_GCAxxG_C_C family probable redox protein